MTGAPPPQPDLRPKLPANLLRARRAGAARGQSVRASGRGKFAGRLLLRTWAVAAVIYVVVAGAWSVAPIKAAVLRAQEPVRAQPAPVAPADGPIPDAPDSPATALAKSLAWHLAVVVGPPALTLWFGWDLWFAATGLLELRARARRPDDSAS